MGVDIGGTFTDIVLLGRDGTLHSKKVLSTPDDYSRAIEEGIKSLLDETGIPASRIVELAHGTTVATNAIIERKGVKVALVTTQGFGDVLEIGRFHSPRLYDMEFQRLPALVERRLRFEVKERVNGKGEVLVPLDLAGLTAIAEAIRKEGALAVAICFINAYVNPEHENAARDHLGRCLPDVSISTSTQLLPQVHEFERTSTTVINAYIRPVVEHYVRSLNDRMQRIGIVAPLMIMQSSGGILPCQLAGNNPVYIIESGPAAGVVGAQQIGARFGFGDLMVLDMGGTTAKASIIQNGQFSIIPEGEVGGDALLGHRLMRGSGYPVQVPTIDIAEVGAGGGSIASVDAAGGMQVGPRSAGSVPGPVCYDRGGALPTVTDANLILGYLNPRQLVGGELAVNFDKAEQAVAQLGRSLNLSATEAAYGIHAIANATMMRALSGVSSERGKDPSQFTLLTMGGNGPVHGAGLAEAMNIARIVVPPVAGLFSALGLLCADVEHSLIRAFYRRVSSIDPDELNAFVGPMIAEAEDLLKSEGFSGPAQRRIEILAEIKYFGQTSTLSIPIPVFPVDLDALLALRTCFDDTHKANYGYNTSNESHQIIAIKVIGRGLSDTPRLPDQISRAAERIAERSERRVYFGPTHGWMMTAVRSRTALGRQPVDGPIIIEEYDTTTVVRPGWKAWRDDWNNIVVERASERRSASTGAISEGADPIKRELIRHALTTIADNMIVTVIRTSRSTVVKNGLDFSTSICDANGQMVAQGLALPAHLGATMPALKACLDFYGDDIHPGDILANNDPYSGASHLNDVFMFKPVYAPSGERLAFICIILHHTDMGGRVPGGNATDSTEIFQEGLRIPPLKIYDKGSPNATLLRIIGTNVRVPEQVLGDFKAQIAALFLGEREMLKLLDDYDVTEIKAYMTGLIDYTERLARAGIAALPDGEAEFTDWNDDDGIGDTPVKFQVKLTVKGSEIVVDYTGTSPQTSGALNPNFWYTVSSTYAAIRSVLPRDMPNNAGFYRPIKVIAPEGCFVNPRFPAAFGARGQASFRIRSIVLGALSKFLPQRVPACTGGSEFGIVIAGYGHEQKAFLFLEFHNVTGIGGRYGRDGEDAGPYWLRSAANTPVEMIEAEHPVLIEAYAFLPDTEGAGRWRGALGVVRQYRILADTATVQVRSDRQRFQPWGLNEGNAGAPGRMYLNPGPEVVRLPSKFMRTLKKGDVLRAEMPGAGGWGNPFERDPQAVLNDVRQRKLSAAHAREAYGVVIDSSGEQVDLAVTKAVRAELAKTAARSGANRPKAS